MAKILKFDALVFKTSLGVSKQSYKDPTVHIMVTDGELNTNNSEDKAPKGIGKIIAMKL